MPLSVRLDAGTESRLRRLARESGRTKSEVVREAIAEYGAQRMRNDGKDTPYERMKHVIGSVRGGPPDLSDATGDKFAALMRQRARGRARAGERSRGRRPR